MSGWARLVGACGVLFAGMMVFSSVAAGVVATTTYSVTFSEVGVPAGTAWSVTFNGVTYTPNQTSVTITGLSSGSYYWYSSTVAGSTGVQYATTGTTSGYMTVPSQKSQVLVYQKQYQVTFAVTPSNGGFVNPSYTQWENSGAQLPISAGHYTGFSFTTWKLSKGVGNVASLKSSASVLTVTGAGTVTASMKTVTSAASISEVGLPSGTTWTVVFNGVAHSSSTSSIALGSQTAGSYYWSISPVSSGTGVEYLAAPSSGSLSMPYLDTQVVVFTKQDQLTLAVSPSGGGSTSPTTGYVPDGVPVPLIASASTGYRFSAWSTGSSAATISNTTRSSTTVTLTGPATVTAKFATGTLCTKCSATFYELGLPSGTTWGVSVNGVLYSSSTSSLVLTGLTSAFSFSTPTLVGSSAGAGYSPEAVSGYFNIPYQSSVTLQFLKVYLVTLAGTPPGTGYLSPGNPAWYVAGTTVAVDGIPYDNYAFKSWSSSAKSVPIASKSSQATTFTVGGPATITASFASPARTVSFVESGLPAGTTWSIYLAGVTYYSSGAYLNVTGVAAASYQSWSVYTPVGTANVGIEYAAVNPYGYFIAGYLSGVEVGFYKQVQLTVQAGGTSGGSVNPSGTMWVANGTLLAVSAINGTSVNFHAWGSTGGPFTIGQTTSAATTVLVGGPGNVTATFK